MITKCSLTAKTFTLLDKNGQDFTPPYFDDLEGSFSVVSYVATGFDHLLGQTVSILGDNAVFPPQEVVSNIDGTGGVGVKISSPCNKIICGIPYAMQLKPESIELPGSASIGGKKRISKVKLKLYETLGGYAGTNRENLEEMRFRDTTISFGTVPSLFTGVKTINVDSSTDSEAEILLYHDQPLPMTILAIISDITYTIYEGVCGRR